MAIDFPNSPTLNQTFTGPNGIIWQWDGVKWIAIPATNPSVGAGNVGRNLLHNPLFNVAQRGVGPFTVSGYSADRWQGSSSTSTYTVNLIAATDADRTAIGDEAVTSLFQSACVGTAGAGDYVYQNHFIEDVRRTAGKTVTISFWARATAGTPKIGLELVQIFGSGGSPSAAISAIGAQALTLSTTWTRYVATINIPSIAGKTLGTTVNTSCLGIVLWQTAGSTFAARSSGIGQQSYTLQLWGVQLEIGSVATPLEKPDPQQDLAKCQRFAVVSSIIDDYMSGATSSALYRSYKLPVTMRAWPTLTFAVGWQYYSAGTPTAVTPIAGNVNADFIGVRATGLTNAGGFVQGTFTASADL